MERHEQKHTDRAQRPEAFDAEMERAIRAGERRERLMIGAWVSATVVALVATVTLLESCGGSRTSSTPSASTAGDVDPGTVAVAASVGGDLQGGTTGPGPLVVGDGSTHDPLSVPPDVIPSVSDTLVTAGQAVEVVVEATPDVTEMALSDGFGDAIPMVRDSTGLTWRVNYRVPLRPRSERLGLSVTARNQDHRWRRVWLFLEVGQGQPRVESQAVEPVEGGEPR
jgi:hypothetical protein